MSDSRIMICILVILMFFAAACASSQPQQEQKTEAPMEKATGNIINVAIKGFKFAPADVNVKVGDTVVWTNEDTASHTVESADGILKSDELSKGDSYSYKFTKAGKYDYICGIHPSMKGSITVQ